MNHITLNIKYFFTAYIAPANSLNGMIDENDDELSDEFSSQAVEQVINDNDEGIIPKAVGLAPLFTVHPISQTVKEGDTVCLECTVSGDPIPEAEWYYNDGPIQAGHIFSQDNEIIKLELQALLPEDTGTYECRVTSSMGKASTVAFLVVERKLNKGTVFFLNTLSSYFFELVSFYLG